MEFVKSRQQVDLLNAYLADESRNFIEKKLLTWMPTQFFTM